MDAEKLKELEELLTAESTESLRFHFADGEIYDLDCYSIIQDSDDEPPKCSAKVIQPVEIPEGKRKFFKPDSGMVFLLSDVVEARDVSSLEVIFHS